MARIRTIKPEFWTSEQIVECSTSARLLFIGLWNFCDDQGVHPASCKRLKMEVFPADGCSTEDVAGWIGELEEVGLLVTYEAQDKVWWAVTGWHHQKIDRPTNRYPPPEFPEPSTSPRRALATEGKGRDREGIGKGKDSKGDTPLQTPSRFDPARVSIPGCLNTEAFLQSWGDWIEHRKQIRKKLTALAVQKQIKRLAEMGEARAIAAIEHTIEKGWTGIQEPDRPAGEKPAFTSRGLDLGE